MPRLPRPFFKRPDRPGIWFRDRRGSADRWYASPTLKEAKRLHEQVFGSRVSPSRRTVKEAVEAWLQSYIATARNERGQRLARQRANSHLVPAIGARPLWLITADDLRAYRLRLEARVPALSPQTVAHILSDARCLFEWTVEAGWIGASPVPRRLLPRLQDNQPRRIPAQFLDAVLSTPEPYGFIVRLLVGSGVRWSESKTLFAEHIDDDAIIVEKSKSKRVRKIPLSAALLREIRGRIGRLVCYTNAQTVAKHVRAHSGFEGFTVHMARHTFAYRHLEAGGTVHGLQELMGHSSLDMTLRYLRGLSPLAEKEAREVTARRDAER